ncbi:alpha/beta hydrolase [Streptomyces bathyalis]|uniref:Alpha/beta hydrolase n=1 Tax=Streptomyces bathyalis TaxID=2710756 RepID=A0A7T1WTX0_9ACTN|nr:alpha/beta hydrolase [Streptomyces bathyalis]QPP07270.1 alpha/beta hydrolase [Streptomyces bathyalis]
MVAGSASGAQLAMGDQADDALDQFEQQKIDWHRCKSGGKDEIGKQLEKVKAKCAEITVPLNYRKPQGRTVKVSIARRAATDKAHKLGTLVINTGGPGESKSGINWVVGGFPPYIPKGSPKVASRYDLVSLDPRFMASSRGTVLECGWTNRITNTSTFVGPDRRSFKRSVALNKDMAARCAKHQKVLPHLSTRNIARDMDVVRAALGEKKLSYLGWSYGGYLGAVYSQMFPGRLGRTVLDSSPDPHTWGPASDRENAPVQAKELRKWAAWASRYDDRYHLGTTTARVLATFDHYRQVADKDRTLRIGRHRINANNLRSLGIGPDPDDPTSYKRATSLLKMFLDAARGKEVKPTKEQDQFLAQTLSNEVATEASASAATLCADRAVSRDPETNYRDIQAHYADDGFYGPPNRNVTPCTFWPAGPAEPSTKVHNNVPALVVGSTEDSTTPYSGQLAMHRALTGSRMVTQKGSGGHVTYLAYHGAPCVDTTVDRYLLGGDLPAKDITCTKDKPSTHKKAEGN